jgi:2,3-dihydroxy-p-cumate/2,3-dihydroxybenzoate 3,4-dioxygenase
VLIRAQEPAFNHFCIQVESIDDVMRFRHNAVRHGVALKDDLLRHAPSGSIGVYIKDDARGFSVEYCVGHPQLDDASHQPRILPLAPETVDIWRSPLPEPRRPAPSVAPPGPPAVPPRVPAAVSSVDADLGTTAFLAKAAAHNG